MSLERLRHMEGLRDVWIRLHQPQSQS